MEDGTGRPAAGEAYRRVGIKHHHDASPHQAASINQQAGPTSTFLLGDYAPTFLPSSSSPAFPPSDVFHTRRFANLPHGSPSKQADDNQSVWMLQASIMASFHATGTFVTAEQHQMLGEGLRKDTLARLWLGRTEQ